MLLKNYLEMQGVSSHMLIEMLRSPLHCYSKYIDPLREKEKPTPSMILGSLVHCLVLTPSLFETEFVVFEGEKKTTAQKEKYQELEKTGKTIVTKKQVDIASKMAAQVLKHPKVIQIMDDGEPEITLVMEREKLLPLKCRLDWLDNGKKRIIELKTTCNANASGFAAEIARHKYHLTAAYYQHIAGNLPHVFIAVENKPPFAVAVYESSPALLAEGHRLWQDALARFDECWEKDEWPGYPNEISPIELPNRTATAVEIDFAIGDLNIE